MTAKQNNKKNKVRKGSRAHLQSVERLFREGTVVGRAQSYVDRCRDDEDKGSRFPNLAGLCKVLGIGLTEMQRLGDKYPLVYDAILAVLEDGALNADSIPGKSALLTMTYFRRRLGYEVPKTPSKSEDGAVKVVFEHDIGEDGK